jgi:SagB-type dehydrogenase family enzyme
MDKARMGRRLAFLCSTLDDPRRIQLRQEEFLQAYRSRGGPDDLIEISHDLTKLGRANSFDVFRALTLFQQPAMHAVEYTHDREFPLQPIIHLPEPAIPDSPFSELIRSRRSGRRFGGSPLTLAQLSALLFGAIGETGRLTTSFEDGHPVEASLRSIPSGGALHPTRAFVAVLQQGQLAPGVYHFDVPTHALEFVKPLLKPDMDALFAAFPVHPDAVNLAQASGIFFITTKFWRARAKYGPRGYRYCLQEAGAASQNLSLTAVALGLAHVVLGGFYDDEVHAILEIDGVDHAVVTSVVVGTPPQQQGVDMPDASL